jgi:delta-aminolevulinic acid dehydratase/porphobilinogen synthase
MQMGNLDVTQVLLEENHKLARAGARWVMTAPDPEKRLARPL